MRRRSIRTIDEFQQYVRRVMSFMGHSQIDHGLIYTLLIHVLAAHDPNTDMGDWGGFCLDATINGHIFVFSYNRREYRITVRRDHKAGQILADGVFNEHATVRDAEHLMETLCAPDPCRFHPNGHRLAA